MTTAPTLDDARAALRKHFSYPAFRPGQEAAVQSVLSGRDTLVVLPTGGGKSLCYQVPALMLPKLTVVISPLISLMKDQVDALAARGLPATFINSTLPSSQVSDRLARAARGELKLLYVAPERFDAGRTAERLRNAGVSLLAVDEAHCISEWGHDFRPSYLRIASVREQLGWPPTVALTATATPHVRSDIVAQLKLDSPTTIITGFDRTNLSYHVIPAPTERDKDDALVQLLRSHDDGLAVVYASTRKAVERIAQVLERARVPAAAYHAGLDDTKRHTVQDAFMTEKVRAIVATNAFGMGIDKPNVRLVVHYAMPGTLEAYYQEAGRAGRDGNPAACYLLHAFPDRFTHEFFIKGNYPERALVEEVYDVLRRNTDTAGGVDASPNDIATRLKTKATGRDVESVLRLLAQAGAYATSHEGGSRVIVRLLATPERIKRELTAESGLELGILRAMWRVAGEALNDGATIDLDGLPPGFGGGMGSIPLLDGLQSRQFLEWRRAGGGAVLPSPKRPLSAFKIDWAAIERRRRADLQKLDAVQQYAYTKGCRRGFVLRYFGDAAARSSCSGCDNCLGTRVEVERGTATSARSRPSRGQRRHTDERAPDDAPTLSGADEALLARLRDLRRTIAKQDQVPAYVVFADRTLAEMAVRRPTTSTALGAIRGVGPAKIQKYGDRFLDVIRTFDETEAA